MLRVIMHTRDMRSTDCWRVGLNFGLLVTSALNDCPLANIPSDRSAETISVRRHGLM